MITFKDGIEIGHPDALGIAKLELACKHFERLSNHQIYARVQDIWCDYGARLWYKQIVIYRGCENDSFQISPNEREAILNAVTEAGIIAAVTHSMEKYPELYTASKRR